MFVTTPALRSLLCAGLFAAGAVPAVAAPSASASASASDIGDSAGLQVPDYTVFVEPASRFAFIKIPGYGRTGWKFIGQIDARTMKHLPEGTLTSLVAEPSQFAGATKGEARASRP